MAILLQTVSQRRTHVERAMHGLYRCYVHRLETTRQWNADHSFNWASIRKDHSAAFMKIIEGFYAVEQYVTDYTAELIRLFRHNYGRSQFQIRWGAEEQRHSDGWRNVLLFSEARTREHLEAYTESLRGKQWTPPFSDALEMLLYTVLQERATQQIYLNTAKVAKGETLKEQFRNDVDPVVQAVAMHIAVDEAAHYNFFLDGARLYLYYFPDETMAAIAHVLRHFKMPSSEIIPDYDMFIRDLYAGDLFGKRKYARDVVSPVLANLGVTNYTVLNRTAMGDERNDVEGTGQESVVRRRLLESTVQRLFVRIQDYEDNIGLSSIAATRFIPC